MPAHQSFGQQRLANLAHWATGVDLPGLKKETYSKLLDYVIRQQEADGRWSMEGKAAWDVVLTSVVLKSLADLEFENENNWTAQQDQTGGVGPAIEFLTEAVKSANGSPEKVGEDIWDACQAALALAKFGHQDVAMPMVRALNRDWKKLYEKSRDENNRWSCPAYLAAIVDVLGGYESYLDGTSQFDAAFGELKKLEQKIDDETSSFPSDSKRKDTDIWSTSLVLRTISTVPELREKLIDRDQVQRGAAWLLQRLDSNVWKQEVSEAPMYLARALQGLRESRRWVDSQTRQKIDQKVKSGNRELAEFFDAKVGHLKSYSAVLEYLASSKIAAPAALVFDARETLRVSMVLRPACINISIKTINGRRASPAPFCQAA